jgi:hypothetical protein
MEQNKIIKSDASIKQYAYEGRDYQHYLRNKIKNRGFEFVKNLFCKGLNIILPLTVFFNSTSYASVYLKNIGSETIYVLRLDYNIIGRKWHRDGWYQINPGKRLTMDEGCCNGNPYLNWQRHRQSFVVLRDKNRKILKYNWKYGKAATSVCVNTKKNYDEHIDLSDTVGLFDRLTWPSKYSKCSKGEIRTEWVYEIPDRANIEQTITVRSR